MFILSYNRAGVLLGYMPEQGACFDFLFSFFNKNIKMNAYLLYAFMIDDIFLLLSTFHTLSFA